LMIAGKCMDQYFLNKSYLYLFEQPIFQKEDWPKHKELCKILKSLREQNLTGSDAVSYLTSKLKRPLNQFEFDIANHPRVCMVCNKYDPADELKNCKQCFCVAFCPKCVESGICNLPSCKALKIAAEDYKNEQTLGHQVHTINTFF
jgi:hypothetical protein